MSMFIRRKADAGMRRRSKRRGFVAVGVVGWRWVWRWRLLLGVLFEIGRRVEWIRARTIGFYFYSWVSGCMEGAIGTFAFETCGIPGVLVSRTGTGILEWEAFSTNAVQDRQVP